MKPGLTLFVAFESCAGFWSLFTSSASPTQALVVALTALAVAVLYVIGTEWAIPAAIARLTVGQQPVMAVVTAGDADGVFRELLSAAMGEDCWHVRGATRPGCGCRADREERARDARRQDMRFLRGPVRIEAGR